MIGWISAEEALKNVLAWIGPRGTGIVLAAVVSWWLCRIACTSSVVFRRKLTAGGRVAFFILFLAGAIHGGGKARRSPPPAGDRHAGIVQAYRVESVATNAAPFSAMPPDAVEYAEWSSRGGRDTWFQLDLCGWSFPFGTNSFSRLRILSGGMVEMLPASNGSGSICAAREEASLVPGVGRFWSADAEDGAKVLRWEDVFAGRDRTGGYTAEIRLSPNGDFTTRSNDVETVCRRVNPDDWDGDGIVNDLDANPEINDGNFFGPENILPDGANTNAYCTISLVVSGYDSLVTFRGEGSSNYPDPRFIARAGETNDVLILIGKTYHVSSVAPASCAGVSDPETEIVVHDSCSFSVLRPVEISFSNEGDPPLRMRAASRAGASGGGGFSASVMPPRLGGEFFFESCCAIEGVGLSFSFLHDEYCSCRGCRPLGCYRYEGFEIAASPPSCCCSRADEGGGGGDDVEGGQGPSAASPVSVSFSLPFAFHEDSYVSEVGGSRVGARARPVLLKIGVFGGSYGGNWTLTIDNEEKLRRKYGDAAAGGTVRAGEVLELEREYVFASPSASANDIVATVSFTENSTGSNYAETATLTAVKLQLEAVKTVSELTIYRHYFGVAEDVICTMIPDSVPGLFFHATKGSFNAATGRWTCPVVTNLVPGGLEVRYGGKTQYAFWTWTTPPTGIVAKRAVGLDFNVPPGTAGGAGMKLDLYVLPESVSFSKLSLAEVPTETEGPSGYFTNMEFSAVWYHTLAMGSGEWHQMRGIRDTYWFPDHAQMGDAFPSRDVLEWAEGTIVWDIPVAWELSDVKNKTYDKRIREVYEQRFDFNSSGTLRVSKHGYWEERDADNSKRGSEGINIWETPEPGP